MAMRILQTALITLSCFLPSISFAQTIALDELLRSVQADHPLFRRETRNVAIERENQAATLAAQDWQITSSAVYAYQEPPGDDLFTPTSSQNTDFHLGLVKPLWTTGGRFSLSFSEMYTDTDFRRLNFGGAKVSPGQPYAYGTSVYLAYSQPLLRNAQGSLDRLDYELAQFTVEMAKIRATEEQEKFLLDLALRYLDWNLYFYQKDIVEERLRLAREQLEQVRRRREMNLVEEVDVFRALDAVHAAEQLVVQIEARYSSIQTELAEIALREDLYDLSPEYDLYAEAEIPDADNVVSKILDRSRLLKALDVSRQQLKRQLGGAEETHDPDLSLDLGYGMQRRMDGFFDALAVTKPDAFVALNLSFPLGRREAKAQIQKTQLMILQVEDRMRETEIQLESALRSLLIDMEMSMEIRGLDRRRIESARQKAAEELKLYNQGRGQLTFVISARDDVERAELNLTQSALAYQKLMLQYRELMDELLPLSSAG
ncbi:MAG: hypothetical protein GF355_05975 [Candidatus Eisenbacteria bacterium]|nr:hypothetical protein [Candidatus Eisenbacteria bacterium]